MQRLKKIALLTVLLGLLGALKSYSVGSSCYQVNNTPARPTGAHARVTSCPAASLCLVTAGVAAGTAPSSPDPRAEPRPRPGSPYPSPRSADLREKERK